MQKVKDSKNELRQRAYILEAFKNELEAFTIENNIEDIKQEGQGVFSAFCMYAGQRVFIKDFFAIACRGGALVYDYLLLLDVVEVYLYICRLYNKIPSIIDYSYFVNIDYSIIKGWARKPDEGTLYNGRVANLSNMYINSLNSVTNISIYYNSLLQAEGETITTLQGSIFSKLHTMREDALKGVLLSNKNPVGVLGVVNNEYKWNVETIKEEAKARALTLQELPQLQLLCKPKEE